MTASMQWDAGGTTRCGTARAYKAGCRCLGCRVAIREHNRRYRQRHPEAVREAARRRELEQNYGITPEQLHEMKIAQGWRCAVCRQHFPPGDGGKRVHVDHCHRTGVVRGVLCARCNSGIGKLGDSVEGLRRALRYLERSLVLLALLVIACGGDNVAPIDAPPVQPCCDLGAELAPACIGAQLPPGTCAVFVCPYFEGEACGGPKRCHCSRVDPPRVGSLSICGC